MNVKLFIKRELSGWSINEIITFLSILIIVGTISIILKDSILATISAIFGLIYTIIAGKGKISCYFFGMIGTLCYAYLSFKNGLYGNFLLYFCYYFPMEIMGIFTWKKHLNKETQNVKKTFLNNKKRMLILLFIIIGTIISGFCFEFFNGKYPFFDSFVTISSVAGMYLTVKRCIEQWVIWSLVNFVCSVIWLILVLNGSNTIATFLMWLIYLFLGIYFFFKWKQEIYKKNEFS